MLPASLAVPAGQPRQTDPDTAPFSNDAVPFGHRLQALWPCLDWYLPPSHSRHEVEPFCGAYRPEGHISHAVTPTLEL